MHLNDHKLTRPRQIITENLCIQRDGNADLPYIDVSNADAMDKLRSAPVLRLDDIQILWESAPSNVDTELLKDAEQSVA